MQLYARRWNTDLQSTQNQHGQADMGKVLASYFNMAKEKGGLVAQMKLAIITKMSKEKALQAPDSQENIKLFEEVIRKLGDGQEQGDVALDSISFR